MLLSDVRNGRDSFIPESAQVSGTPDDLGRLLPSGEGRANNCRVNIVINQP